MVDSRKQIKRLLGWLIVGLLLIAFGPQCFAFVMLIGSFMAFDTPQGQSLRATENALIVLHGQEARMAIETFMIRDWSLDSYIDPRKLSEVATGQMLKSLEEIHAYGYENTVWINRASTVGTVNIIEYSPIQFKAFSCEVLNLDSVTMEGAFVSSDEPRVAWSIYVFRKENGVWKVAARADFTDADHIERDWTEGSFPEWERDIVGDLPRMIDDYISCP